MEEESFAISWNKEKKGLLASTANTTICIWDVEKQTTPSITFSDAHVDAINDIKFSQNSKHAETIMISTSDDGHFKIWDIRLPS